MNAQAHVLLLLQQHKNYHLSLQIENYQLYLIALEIHYNFYPTPEIRKWHESHHWKSPKQTGFAALLERGFDYVLILDGDGQHLPGEIPAFLAAAESEGAEMILGNRMSANADMPWVRRMTNRFMSWLIGRICGQPIPDTQCGFRMIHRELIPHLFCESDAFDYESEMLFIAARRGYRITSVSVSTVYGDERSKIRPIRDAWRFLKLVRRNW